RICADFVFENSDGANCFDRFHTSLLAAISQSMETIQISAKQRLIKPWMTTGLLQSVRTRDKLYRRLRKYPQDERLSLFYKNYQNRLKYLIKISKETYARSRIQEQAGNLRKQYEFIKEYANLPQRKGQVIDLSKFNQNREKAVEDLNNYFASIGKRITEQNLVETHDGSL